jgi:hypothetical protein
MGFTSLSDRLFSFLCFFYWNLPILRQTSCVIDASCVIDDVMNRVKSCDEVHNGLCDELYGAALPCSPDRSTVSILSPGPQIFPLSHPVSIVVPGRKEGKCDLVGESMREGSREAFQASGCVIFSH